LQKDLNKKDEILKELEKKIDGMEQLLFEKN
jgi:hypothetical protein